MLYGNWRLFGEILRINPAGLQQILGALLRNQHLVGVGLTGDTGNEIDSAAGIIKVSINIGVLKNGAIVQSGADLKSALLLDIFIVLAERIEQAVQKSDDPCV